MGSRPAGAMTGRGTRPGKGSTWERGRLARILLLMVVAELPRGFAGSHPLATETAMTKPKETHLGARASRPYPYSLMEAAERQREFAGIHPVDGNGNDQAEGEPRRGCRSTQVAEMAEAAPRHCAGGTPALPGGASSHVYSWPFVVRLYFLPPLSTFFRFK